MLHGLIDQNLRNYGTAVYGVLQGAILAGSKVLALKGCCKGAFKSVYADPWADPESRSLLGFHNLHHRSIRASEFGDLLLGSPQGVWAGTGGGREAWCWLTNF